MFPQKRGSRGIAALASESIGARDHPASDSFVPHGNKDKLILQEQAAVDDVLDTKRFWL